MKAVLAVLLFTFIQCDVEAVVLKRQAPDSACFVATTQVSSRELQCLYGSTGGSGDYSQYDDNAGSDDYHEPTSDSSQYDYESGFISSLSFTRLCADPFCSNFVVNKVIPNCRSFIQDNLPDEYKGIDIGKLLAVFCAKDSSGIGCYNQLPKDNFDMFEPCERVLNTGACNKKCKKVLLNFNTSCCFSTLASVLPYHTRSQVTRLQAACNVYGSLCDVDYDTYTSNSKGDSGSNLTIIGAAAGGGVLLLAVVIVILIIIVIVVTRKGPSTSRTHVSMKGDVVRMPLTDNEDPDD
ncbi:uncharacterized protein [Dysidea avara]|uniref:uncharacterized protein n=1 Tax=Dysidea avara TaxID=196820 RepID=UPI0033185AEF